MSINGLHITMVAGLFAVAAFTLWRHSFFTRAQLPLLLPTHKVAALVGAALAFFYVLLAGFGVLAMGWGGGTGLGGNHASISGSPLEEVARDLLVKSTSFLTETIAAKNINERVAVKATDVSPK